MTIQQEIQQGESRTLEFKKELPEDSAKWVKTVVAFFATTATDGKVYNVDYYNRRKIIA